MQNARSRKVIDANILLMTQRPLQKVTYKTSTPAKDKEKKKNSNQSTQYCKSTNLNSLWLSYAVQIYDRLFLYHVEFKNDITKLFSNLYRNFLNLIRDVIYYLTPHVLLWLRKLSHTFIQFYTQLVSNLIFRSYKMNKWM